MKRQPSKKASTVVAVDTGGTFTDFYVLTEKGLRTHKVLSTPKDPSLAIARGLNDLKPLGKYRIIHGSTVATNALIERKGARVALVTTSGFEDVLEIGRQNRPNLYALHPEKEPPLVERHLRLGVDERMGPGGKILRPLSKDTLRTLIRSLRSLRCESIAICFLHSYANPSHERAVALALKRVGKAVSTSHEICPEFREYERCSTTCVNAYVAPVMERYLQRLKKRLSHPIRVLQSNGGSLSIPEASRQAVRTILSGPAGGALGAMQVSRRAGFDRLITLDIGGTSTDLSLIAGDLEFSGETTLGDCPIKTPMIRIDTLGAGGGSLAWVDAGGALRVGPESAGADPGPICYGRGRKLTVTDAQVALGRIPPEHFLGGRMPIFPEKIRAPLDRLARRLKLTREAAAEGILAVANANIARSLRVLSVERGHDPRRFTLLPFGGAGALHAAELAEELSIPQILIPKFPGLLSAYGMAHADWRRDYVKTLLWKEGNAGFHRLKKQAAELETRARKDAIKDGIAPRSLRFAAVVDLRYQGQSYEIEIPLRPHFRQDFSKAHFRLYGFRHRGRPIEIVNLRVRAQAPADDLPDDNPSHEFGSYPTPCGFSRLYWRGLYFPAPIFLRESLPAAFCIEGPAIVAEFSATTFVAPGWNLRVETRGELLMKRGKMEGRHGR